MQNVFPGDLVVCENPWDQGKLLVRRVKSIGQSGASNTTLVWVASETLNGGIDSKVFGPIPVSSILGRAIYYYNNDSVELVLSFYIDSWTYSEQPAVFTV